MHEKLETIHQDALKTIQQVNSLDELQAWESRYMGRNGQITSLLRDIGSLPKEDRATFGQQANQVKNLLVEAHAQREHDLREIELQRSLEASQLDVTLPGRSRTVGGLHPSTQMLRRIQSVWAEMGFQVYRSRDVETDEVNFTLLNIPPYHPARDMQDTFYTTQSNIILRTHTSPGQIRAMREYGESGTRPIRVVLPGMCYRYEQISVRSEIQFHQIEGLAIGKGIRMSDLKGTLAEFARRMFGPDTQVRYRASYFPFTEPSMEVDISCMICHGEGCAVCKRSGWLEILGSGMVHPVVLRNGGYDPRVWSGFAFGMGPERITMLKHHIEDIRYFWANDLRFLEQF